MTKDDTFARVDKAIANGSLWKAKEILQGNVSLAHGYRPDFYEKYGQLLLQMGDLIEAGKYLFLSGKRLPNYEEAISLYLKRFSKSNSHTLLFTFPKASRLSKIEDYPKEVQKHLLKMGYTSSLLTKFTTNPMLHGPPSFLSKVKSKIIGLILILILLAFIVGIVSVTAHGLILLSNWIFP